MTMLIACPTCQSRIRAPESVAGKTIKCPQCKNPFVAAPADAAVEPFAFDEGPSPTAPPPPPSRAAPSAPAVPPPSSAFGFDDDDATIKPTAPLRKKQPDTGSLGDYLLLRRMVTPLLIVGVFYFGVFTILVGSIVAVIVVGLGSIRSDRTVEGLAVILGVGVGSLFAFLYWRIICEMTVLFFRIHEELIELNEQTRHLRRQE